MGRPAHFPAEAVTLAPVVFTPQIEGLVRLRLPYGDTRHVEADNSGVDAEGARELARRIAAQQRQETEQSPARARAGGQTLEQRLKDGPAPAGVVEVTAPAEVYVREVRVYTRELEERDFEGQSAQVAIWRCRPRRDGVWQEAFVVREEMIVLLGSSPERGWRRPLSWGFRSG